MGCSGRVKKDDIRPEQKWEFISLNDFKTSSCFKVFAYGYLWLSLFISIAVYAVDTFTAVNLLVFDRWTGGIQPVIPLDVSKWIFSICIIASWINLAFEHIRAMRVMKRGAVAESYLDSLAVRLESIKVGKGRGWRRFLVFTQLTKSKKGAEYVALFTYFSFQSWIRIIFCQGPRQVINALTLYSVFKAELGLTESNNVGTAFLNFFHQIGLLAVDSHRQAVILSGMVFTLVIWIFGALSLILAILFYILFLWHYIPNADGGLSGYCERKINLRLAKIVSVKVNKAIEEEERKRIKADAKAIKKGDKPVGRQATLPTLFDPKDSNNLPQMPMLHRNDTMATLPLYESRPGTPSGQPTTATFELSSLDQKRPVNGRSFTGTSTMSTTSFDSNAPLMNNASNMGYGRTGSPAPSVPSLPPLDTNGYPLPPQRSLTGQSNGSNWSRSQITGPPRMPSAMGERGYTASPVSYIDGNSPVGRRPSPEAVDPYGRPIVGQVDELNGRSFTPAGPAPSMGRRTPFDQDRSNTPAGPAPSMGRRTPFDQDRSNTPAGPAPSMGRRTPFDQDVNRSNTPAGPAPSLGRRTPFEQYPASPSSEYDRNSPASGNFNYETNNALPGQSQYQPYNPNMRTGSALSNQRRPNYPPTRSETGQSQYRNVTDPGSRGLPQGDYFSNRHNTPIPRPGTAQSAQVQRLRSGSGSTGGVGRLASPAPYNDRNINAPASDGDGSPMYYR